MNALWSQFRRSRVGVRVLAMFLLAAAVPIVLSKAAEAGRISKGSRVALMGIGSGLNCSMAEVVW